MDETPFTRKPTLRGELVTLRPIRRDDADTIGRIIQDDEIARLTGSVSSSEEKVNVETERFRDVYEAWSRADDRLVLGIVDNATGDLVGEAVLHGWDRYNHSCNFRTFVAADRHGRGLGTEATDLIVHHGLAEMSMHRITLQVYDFNPRARHVYEKVGFEHEGTGRDALLYDDEWVDVHYMAIIA